MTYFRSPSRLAAIFFVAAVVWATALRAQTTRPIAQLERIVIISVDGARPDLLLRGKLPAVRSLIDNGSFTLWARTTAAAITLPSHVSMLTGVPPEKHGVTWNDDRPGVEPVYPNFPTLFEIAQRAGRSTALVSGKAKFKTLAKPGTVNYSLIADEKDDARTAATVVRTIRDHQPQVLFVHFAGADVAGHGKGWGGAEQLLALERIDAGIASILAALDETKLRSRTAILITADHGGAGRTHGPDDARSRHIPWILSGPGIRKNYDLTLNSKLQVNTEDTFATACFLLGLPTTPGIDGKPVMDVLAERELLGE